MTNNKNQSKSPSPIRLNLNHDQRIQEAVIEYERSCQEEQAMIARGEPIFVIPEPNEWEIARRQQQAEREQRLRELPDFYIPDIPPRTVVISAPKPAAKKKKKRAYLFSRITTSDLEKYGYKLISPTRAKHKRYSSYRNLCALCGDWTKGGSGQLCERHCF